MWWFYGVIALAVAAFTAALIWLIFKLVDVVKSINKLLLTVDESMRSTVYEVNENLKNVKQMTGDMTSVTGDIKALSSSIREVGDSVKHVGGSMKKIFNVAQNFGTEAVSTISGVRAGIKTGIDGFLKNLFRAPGK
jgi:uncharacterized protein YoxC